FFFPKSVFKRQTDRYYARTLLGIAMPGDQTRAAFPLARWFESSWVHQFFKVLPFKPRAWPLPWSFQNFFPSRPRIKTPEVRVLLGAPPSHDWSASVLACHVCNRDGCAPVTTLSPNIHSSPGFLFQRLFNVSGPGNAFVAALARLANQTQVSQRG